MKIIKHDIYIYSTELNKIALSSQDDERIICEDKVNTFAIGQKNAFFKKVFLTCKDKNEY